MSGPPCDDLPCCNLVTCSENPGSGTWSELLDARACHELAVKTTIGLPHLSSVLITVRHETSEAQYLGKKGQKRLLNRRRVDVGLRATREEGTPMESPIKFPCRYPPSHTRNPSTHYTLRLYPPNPPARLLSHHFLPSSTHKTKLAMATNRTKSMNPNASV